MLLCETGNKRQKSKYMSSLAPCSLDDEFSALILHEIFTTVLQSIQPVKLSATESLWSLGMVQLGGEELKSCLLLTLYCDTQPVGLTQTVTSTPTHLQSYEGSSSFCLSTFSPKS